MPESRARALRHTSILVLTLLVIEFLDEFVFGAREAAWPLIRTDLGLSYAQVGLLLGLPNLIGNLIEPAIGILGDVWRRRALILGGGVVFALALLLAALSQDFPILLISFILFYPASGAFVSLSQANLMDLDSDRHEQNMARWVLAGSAGVVAGPLALGAAATLGLGWRGLYLFFAGLTVILLMVTRRVYPTAFPDTRRDPGRTPELVQDHPRQVDRPTSLNQSQQESPNRTPEQVRGRPRQVEDSASPNQPQQKSSSPTPELVRGHPQQVEDSSSLNQAQQESPIRTPELVRGHPRQVEDSTHPDRPTFKAGVVNALRALRRPEVLRWLTLLAFSDLMLDVLLGFLALYFVDVVGTTPAQAGMAVAVWTGLALVGDLLLIPLLERVHGLSYLRLSAATELALFPALLLTPGFGAKLVLLALLGLFSAGWYSILKAQLYSAMPGQSGTVMAVGNAFGLVGGLIPLGLGLVAERFDLRVTMWLLLLGPIALLIGVGKQTLRVNRQRSSTSR